VPQLHQRQKKDPVEMTAPTEQSPSHQSMTLLSRLLLAPQDGENTPSLRMTELKREVINISRDQFDDLLIVANSNHVIVRGLGVFLDIVHEAKDETRAEWALTALATERARIGTALTFLQRICAAIESENHDVAVIKSLDHWPDLGSDLDLYTNANWEDISKLMSCRKMEFLYTWAARSGRDSYGPSWANWRTGRNFLAPRGTYSPGHGRQTGVSGSIGVGSAADIYFAAHVSPLLLSVVRRRRYGRAIGNGWHRL
jgi:hypothetical protein